jgi:hypothetical protein
VNLGKHFVDVCFYFGVGKAQDEQVMGSKDAITSSVVFRLMLMDCAVKLDDEVGGMAVEVRNEATYDLLASPAHAIDLVAAQAFPQQLFSLGHVTSKFSGARYFHW